MKEMQAKAMVRTAGAGRPYGAEDRARIVAHAMARRRAGAGVESIAREVGVSSTTLYDWLRRPTFERVEVTTDVLGRGGHTVHGPRGVRVEGLSLAEVAELLSRLA
jgi:predicted transcriptional regulator